MKDWNFLEHIRTKKKVFEPFVHPV